MTTVRIHIGKVIANEYFTRSAEHIPSSAVCIGMHEFTLAEAQAILDDAEHLSDPSAVDIGPHATPRETFNAYRALAEQVREAIAKAKGG